MTTATATPHHTAFSGLSTGHAAWHMPQRAGAVLALLALHALVLWGVLNLGPVHRALMKDVPLLVAVLSDAQPPQQDPQPRWKQPAPAAVPAPPYALPPYAVPPEISIDQPSPLSAAVAAAGPQAAPAPDAAAPQAYSPPLAATTPAVPAVPQPVRQLPASAVVFSEPPVIHYPKASKRNAESGTVIVRAFVGAEGGAARSVHVEQSSGFLRLDQAAVSAVQLARFKPTIENGRAIEGWARIPIHFELER